MEISEIKMLIDQGKYPQALEAIDILTGEEKLKGLILRSRIFQRKGDIKEALAIGKRVLNECRASGEDLLVLKALLTLGFSYLALNNIPELTNILQEAEKNLSLIKIEDQNILQECKGALAFLQGEFKANKGDIDLALELLEKSLVIRQALLYQHDVVDTLTTIGFIHLNITGKKELALDLFKRSLSISEKLGNQTAIAHSLNRLGCYHHTTNNFDEALSYFEKSLALYQSLDNKEWIGGLYNNISLIYREKENYDLTLNYLERAFAISEELGDKGGLIINHNNIGWLYAHKGNLTTAEEHFKQSIQIAKELDDKPSQAITLMFLGDLNSLWKGELNLGLEYYQRGLSIIERIGSEPGIGWALLRLGMLHILRGEPEKALNDIKQSESIFIKIDEKGGLGNCYVQLGRVYKLLGKYDKAIKSLEDALTLFKDTIIGANIGLWMSYILLNLILVAQDLDSLELANDYLKQMLDLRQVSKNKMVLLRIKFSEAIVLKMSKRMAQKFQAQQIFQSIIEEESFDHKLWYITVLSMLNLCELLILELKYSEAAEELLEKVIHLSNQLNDIARTQHSSFLSIVALLLRTRLALVQGDVEEASQLLSTAKKIASEKKLINLLARIKTEQETVQTELDKWNELIQRKASIQERVEYARLASWLVEAKKIQETWVNPTSEITNQ